jgi:hypothetical protein
MCLDYAPEFVLPGLDPGIHEAVHRLTAYP